MRTAVVILNWNTKNLLERFLPILIKRTNEADLFVVDNGSKDGSVSLIKEKFPTIELIEFSENLGFTGGYNSAFELLKERNYEYFLLLNSDVEVGEGWLEPLISFMDKNVNVGICSPKIKSYYDKESFEYAGACGGFLDRFFFPYCRGRVLSKVEKDLGQYNEELEVFWASGAAFMIRTDLWFHLGGFDPIFFAHMEEIDMCWRAKLLGHQVWVVPSSEVFHIGGASLPMNSPRKAYLNFRNNLLIIFKNLPNPDYSIFIRKCLDGMIALAYLFLFKYDFFKAVIFAHRDFEKLKKEVKISEKKTKVPRSKTLLIFEFLKHK